MVVKPTWITHTTPSQPNRLNWAEYLATGGHTFDYAIIREASIVVAATDATNVEKAQADYTCDGVQDDVQINAAITEANGQRVRLSTGTFQLAAQITLKANVLLLGAGEAATTLKLADAANCDILEIPRNATNTGASCMRLDGNSANNTSGNGITVKGYTWRVRLEEISMRDIAQNGLNFTSDYSEYNYEPMVRDMDIKGCGVNGANFAWTSDLYSENLYCEGNAGYGIADYGASNTYIHPHVYNSYGDAGFLVHPVSVDCLIDGGHLDTNKKHGLLVAGVAHRVVGCFAFDNGQAAANTYDGINITGAKVTVMGCRCRDGQNSKTQRYGIKLDGDSCVAIGNLVTDNSWGGVNIGAGSGNIDEHNIT